MGNCVDRDELADPKITTGEWSSMVGGPELKSRDLEAVARNGVLHRHFLSRTYGNGLDFLDPKSGYSFEELANGTGLYLHSASGVRIWSQAMDLSGPGDEDLEVLFHYLPAAKLRKLTDRTLLTRELWSSLEVDRALFGQGVYATSKEPAMTGVRMLGVGHANLDGCGPDECCLVILSPKAEVFNVAVRPTPEMMGAFGPRKDVNGSPLGGRDLWVIRSPDVARLVSNCGSNCERRWRRIVQFREEQYGFDHVDTLKSVGCLAAVLEARGKHEEAEPLLRRIGGSQARGIPSVASLTEVVRGQSDAEMTVEQLNELAASYRAKGQFEDSENIYRRAVTMREAEFGAEHLETLVSVNSLATILKFRGKLAEAELLYGRVMLGRESRLGPEHPDTLRSANNLAVCLQARGKLDAAEPLYRVALAGCEATFPPNHADTLTNMNNLAGLLKTKDKLEEAEPLYRRALEGREATLGADNPEVFTSMNNLAVLLQKRNKFFEAEKLHRRALAGREAKLPPQHPDLLTSVNNLAILLQAQARYAEAEPLLKRVLQLREGRLGPEHPDTIMSVNNWALCLQAQGKLSEAEPLHRRAFQWRELKFGADHPETLSSFRSLTEIGGSSQGIAPSRSASRSMLEATSSPPATFAMPKSGAALPLSASAPYGTAFASTRDW